MHPLWDSPWLPPPSQASRPRSPEGHVHPAPELIPQPQLGRASLSAP